MISKYALWSICVFLMKNTRLRKVELFYEEIGLQTPSLQTGTTALCMEGHMSSCDMYLNGFFLYMVCKVLHMTMYEYITWHSR